MNNEILGAAIRNHFNECISMNVCSKIDTYDKYIEHRNKIINEEIKKCRDGKNVDDVVDAILKTQRRILSELNKRLGLSPYNQDFDELLLDPVTEIFCKNFGYQKNDITDKVYYRGGGTSPMIKRERKLKPVSTPFSRLHNWICRQKFDIKELLRIMDETKDVRLYNNKGLREVLNGQCDITLEVLLWMIAIPLNMDSVAFKILAYEVLQDAVDIVSLMSICSLYLDKDPDREQMADSLLKMAKPPARPEAENRPTVCIIGASGFIGSNLIKKIGNRYRLVLQFHKPPTEEMIHDIPDDALIYIGDLRNEGLTKRIFLENNIDFAFWLAASSTRQGCQDYLDAYDTNVDYIKCLFDLLGTKIVTLKGLLLPSTCMLYMYDTLEKTIYRETDLLNYDNLPSYALTKQRLENLAVDMAKNQNVNIIIARLSQIYGPGDTSERLIPKSIANISQNRPLECQTNKIGNPSFVNLIYIDDIVDIFVRICELSIKGRYDFNECRIINIAGKRTYTVLEVMGMLKDVFHSDAEIQKKENQDLNVKVYTVDTSLAEEKVGFNPKISLREGLGNIKEHLS